MVEDWFTYSGCIFDIEEYSLVIGAKRMQAGSERTTIEK